MSTRYPELFAALAAPFDERRDVRVLEDKNGKVRKNAAGEPMRYVEAGTVKNRLDGVLGPENWRDRYTVLHLPESGAAVECRLTLRLPDGSRVTKAGAGQGSDLKAAYSDAIKRAAEAFGVARYLHRCGAPRLDAEAPTPPTERVAPGRPRADRTQPADLPKPPSAEPQPAPGVDTRKASLRFLDWLKEEGRIAGVELARYVNGWGAGRGYPSRIKDWNDDQVKAGVVVARRKLATLGDAREPEPVGANGRH